MANRPVKEKPKATGKRQLRAEKAGRFQRWFQHHQQVAVDSLDRLLKETASSFLTWTVIGIALALPLCLLILLQNLQQFGSDIDEATQITLYLDLGLNKEAVKDVDRAINLRVDVANTQIIFANEALAEFESSSGFADVLSGLDENPLPAVLLVTPKADNMVQIEALLFELQALEDIDSAQLDLEWIQRLNSILSLAQRMILVLAMLLCMGVVLVVGNTVRLTIEGRRAEIVVVKLVGGTDAYVARPFLYAGIWYGVGGGLIACLLVLFVQFGLNGPISQMVGLYESSFKVLGLKISEILLVLLGSGLLGWMGAWLSVFQNLREIEPE